MEKPRGAVVGGVGLPAHDAGLAFGNWTRAVGDADVLCLAGRRKRPLNVQVPVQRNTTHTTNDAVGGQRQTHGEGPATSIVVGGAVSRDAQRECVRSGPRVLPQAVPGHERGAGAVPALRMPPLVGAVVLKICKGKRSKRWVEKGERM